MDQIVLANQKTIHFISQVAAELCHPQPVGLRMDPCDFDAPCRQLDHKQHHNPDQTRPCPHFDGEEVRSSKDLPVRLQELLPSRLLAALRRRLDTVLLEDVRDGAACDLMTEVSGCSRSCHVRLDARDWLTLRRCGCSPNRGSPSPSARPICGSVPSPGAVRDLDVCCRRTCEQSAFVASSARCPE